MKKKNTFKIRQGDVMIRQIGSIPKGNRVIRKDGALAYGEVTGHKHAIADHAAAEVFDCGDGLFISVTKNGGVAVVHEEHGTVRLPKGKYQVTIQREYSPDEIRNVAD